MAHHTEVHPPSDPTEQSAVRAVGPMAGAVLGAVAVVAALIPGLFFLAWPLGGAAIAVSTVASSSEAARGANAARAGRVLGVAALVLGLLNLGIVLGWFQYFTGGG